METTIQSPTSNVETGSPAPQRSEKRVSKKPYDRKNNKNPRYNNPAEKTSFTQKTIAPSLATRIIKYYQPIHTGTSGIDKFSRFVYRTYASRDQRLRTAFTPELLSYVSTLALTYRIYNVADTLCYNMVRPPFYDKLAEISVKLALPEPIARLIESVGSFELPTGVCLVPHAPTRREMSMSEDFLDLGRLIDVRYGSEDVPVGNENSSPRPLRGGTRRGQAREVSQPPPIMEKLLISRQHVGNYMEGAAIGLKFGTLFRKVDYTKTNGTAPFISAFRETEDDRMIGFSPMQIEQSLCQLGACYRFRHVDERDSWIGDNNNYRCVQDTQTFTESFFVIDEVMNHMSTR